MKFIRIPEIKVDGMQIMRNYFPRLCPTKEDDTPCRKVIDLALALILSLPDLYLAPRDFCGTY